MPPKDYEQELLDYLAQQFPATIGHLPLRRMIHAVWQQGMDDAAKICRDYSHSNSNVYRRNVANACEKRITAAAWPNEKS